MTETTTQAIDLDAKLADAVAVAQKVGDDAALQELDATEAEAPEQTPPADAKDTKSSSEPEGDAVAKAKELLKTDPLAAVKAVLGDEGVDALKVDAKKFAALRHEKRKLQAEVEREKQKIAQSAAELRQHYDIVKGYAAAKELFDTGDYAGAFEKAFGEDINEFQKRALRQKMGEDPRVTRLEREIREYRQKEEAERQAAAIRLEEQSQQRAQAEYIQGLKSELNSHSNPTVAKLAGKQVFVDAVFEQLRSHYDPDTDSTISVEEAAELELQRLIGLHNEWASVLQGNPEDVSDRAATPEKQARKQRVSLSQQEAAQAAPPGEQLSPEEIMQKHLRLMARAALQERAQRGAVNG